MDSSVSPKDEIWFLSVCHHISNAVYLKTGVQRSSVIICVENNDSTWCNDTHESEASSIASPYVALTWFCLKCWPTAWRNASSCILYQTSKVDLPLELQNTIHHTSEYHYRGITPLTPNDCYSGRTAPLTSKRFILYIYSTNIGTEYFKHGIYSPFFSLQNAVCFIILTYLVPVLFTFYIQRVLKFKKIIPAPKG